MIPWIKHHYYGHSMNKIRSDAINFLPRQLFGATPKQKENQAKNKSWTWIVCQKILLIDSTNNTKLLRYQKPKTLKNIIYLKTDFLLELQLNGTLWTWIMRQQTRSTCWVCPCPPKKEHLKSLGVSPAVHMPKGSTGHPEFKTCGIFRFRSQKSKSLKYRTLIFC